MKQILALIDFTDTADIAVAQAIGIAKKYNATLTVSYISSEKDDDEDVALNAKLKSYVDQAISKGIASKSLLRHGNLIEEASRIVRQWSADLVVVGTHGKNGPRQNLFGATIYKLVTKIHAPTLVINDGCNVSELGFSKVMLPVAPHNNFISKVKTTAQLVAENGTVVIFAINKPGVALGDKIQENISSAKKYLDEQGVKWDYLEVDSDRYSVGYAKQSIDVSEAERMDLISIMTNVSDENLHFGSMDKENVLLNTIGVPVLCTNS